MKQAEREEVWARVDAQAESVFKDDASMKGFLNFMANCTPQSTRNLLILYEQNPEITHPRTFDKWKEAGRSIRSGEKGYTFFADQEYTKEDGSIGTGYTLTKAYDISQTRGPQPLPPQKHLPEEIIAAIAPIPMSTFAGEPTSNVGKNFLRSYAGVCLEGAIIALACIIFSVMAASPPAVDPNVSAVTAVWSYVGELIFNLLVLVGAVRMSDRIVKELLGL